MLKLRIALFCLVVGVSLATAVSWYAVEGRDFAPRTDVIAQSTAPQTEAPTGFDDESNGLTDPATHTDDRSAFDEVEQIDGGLGPLYNAQSCRECHQNPASGAISQVTELRVGHLDRFGRFTNPSIPINDGSVVITGRSLVNDRAICPNAEFPDVQAQQRVPPNTNVRTLRASLNTLGDGFVEAISSDILLRIAAEQCRRTRGDICGQPVLVPVLEANGRLRVGRFGWKAQHASLLSFSADAYLNEMGITSELLPNEVTTLCDKVADPEDKEEGGLRDIDHFARFMRASKAPPRDPALASTLDAQVGSDLFDRIGCDTCHVPTLVTAPPGSVINGGAFTVPAELGSKIIHPYSDFLLHDVDTGDGIVQNGGQGTAQKLRTPPLWGVRTRTRLLHDGSALTFSDAILQHSGEARRVIFNYRSLSEREKQQIITFLRSL